MTLVDSFAQPNTSVAEPFPLGVWNGRWVPLLLKPAPSSLSGLLPHRR